MTQGAMMTVDEPTRLTRDDLYLFNVVDTPEDAVKVIDDFYAKYLLSPNF